MYEDSVTLYLIQSATSEPRIRRVLLFGSRARGEAQDRADYDIAVDTENMEHRDWSSWALTVRENAPTLCSLDLIWLPELKNELLKKRIRQEGILLYEQKLRG
jgi:predicted nucleotidyltransferase